MKSSFAIRGNRRGFSAFYGAFGVLIVSTAVIGGVLATTGTPPASADAERRLAQEFLGALLASDAADGTSLQQALAASCFAAECAPGEWNASAMQAAIAGLAAPLAKALGRNYLVALTALNQTQLAVGDASPAHRAATASAEVFRPSHSDFVGISLLLGPAL
jgi:hypothetical protein